MSKKKNIDELLKFGPRPIIEDADKIFDVLETVTR
jgi:hypothetical protein